MRERGEVRVTERLGAYLQCRARPASAAGARPPSRPAPGHQRRPPHITSNRALEEWPPLFGDALLASAAMDRLLHHSHVLTIEGDSYRNPPLAKRTRAPRAAQAETAAR
ncbi:ATP-binding protein [Myxococcus qinghaiensis]|uniref:ATP-binding protein n=1 Tax=Myxococcus qinghaiensis TaxID=2906758 RepID=UPI002B20A051|nr:ATP-binding protein [Myxococcus qinghaiensis]